MVHIRSKLLQNYHTINRNLIQKCCTYFDNKRNILFFILFIFVIPTLYIISSSPIQTQVVEETNICPKLLEIIYHSNQTLCSKEAAHRGKNQRIIALSVFGPIENPIFTDDRFSYYITPLIKEAKLIFPTWTIRIYADDSTIKRLNLQTLMNSTTNIDICNVNQLPILGDVTGHLAGKLWRFLPTLDPTVDLISSRDLDSPLIEREKATVDEFINSTYLFLVLRDHPAHGIPVLGGLWTSAIYRDRLLFLHLFSVLLDKTKAKKYSLIHDQTLIHNLVWPKLKNQTLVFDSYSCDRVPGGNQRPFPTQRPLRDCFLGCIRPCCFNATQISMTHPCPEQCRPKDHLDWLYC